MSPECPICLENMQDERATTLCGHHFHTSCLCRVANRTNACPLCRAPLYERDDTIEDHPTETGDLRQAVQRWSHDNVIASSSLQTILRAPPSLTLEEDESAVLPIIEDAVRSLRRQSSSSTTSLWRVTPTSNTLRLGGVQHFH